LPDAMARRARQIRSQPSIELIRQKIGEAEFFLDRLRQHNKRQGSLPNPPQYEFSYHLSAFLNAARSSGKLLAWKVRNWWERLPKAEQSLHDRLLGMRDDTVYSGCVETNEQTKEVRVRFEANYHQQGHAYLFQSLQGEPMTYTVTHLITLADGTGAVQEREIADACTEYVSILRRELGKIEQAIR